MLTGRSMRPGDVPAVAALVGRTFADAAEAEAAQAQLRAAYVSCPWTPPEATVVVEKDGAIIACAQTLALELRLGAVTLPALGIHAIASERRGDLQVPRVLWQHVRARARASGMLVVIGFAQRRGLFVRWGAVPVLPEPEWRLDPRRLCAASAGAFRDPGPDDEPRIAAWHALDGRSRPLGLVRPAELRPWLPRRAPLVRVHPRGYLGLRLGEGALEVREVGGSDPLFYREALLELGELARGAGVREIRGHVPIDHPLVVASIAFGAQVSVDFAGGRSAGLVHPLAVEPLLRRVCDELDARVRHNAPGHALELCVRTAEGEVALALGEGLRTRVELELTPASLLQLVVGVRAPEDILAERVERSGDPAARVLLDDARACALLAAVFPRQYPFIWHSDRF